MPDDEETPIKSLLNKTVNGAATQPMVVFLFHTWRVDTVSQSRAEETDYQ